MDISVSNLGTDPSDDVTVTLIFSDDYCTLTSAATINIGSIASDETITVEDAFSFEITDDAPDMYVVSIDVEIEGTYKRNLGIKYQFLIFMPLYLHLVHIPLMMQVVITMVVLIRVKL